MNVPWYLSRSVGLVAYMLLFLVVVLGISIRTKRLDRWIARWKITDIHIFLSLLTLGFVVFHAVILLWDGFVGYSPADILLPFATGYRTVWTAFGIVTMYLLVVVTLSFPARRWIGYRSWRMLHYTTFVAYIGALVHGIYAGTDSSLAWAQAVYVGTAATVIGLLLYRVASWRRREQSKLIPILTEGSRSGASASAIYAARDANSRLTTIRSRATGIGVGAVFTAGIIFVAAGAGPFGWLSPRDDGGGGAQDAALVASGAGLPGSGDFKDTFSGTTTETQSGGTLALSLVGNGTGDRAVRLDVELQLVQSSSGRTTAASNALTLSDAGGAAICVGQVEQLTQENMVGSCVGAANLAGQDLRLDLQFDGGLAPQTSGTLSATVTK